MYAWFKHPSIGSRVSLLPHHYVNINLQTKKARGLCLWLFIACICSQYVKNTMFFKFVIPCLLDQGVVYYPKICKKTAYFKIFDGNVVCCFYSIVQHCNQASFWKFFLWRPSVCRTKGWYTTPPFLEKLEYIAQKFLLQKKFQAKIETLVLSGLINQYWYFFTELLYKKKITAIL